MKIITVFKLHIKNRHERLSNIRQKIHQNRQKSSNSDSRLNYLHNDGWCTFDQELHQQPWTNEAMSCFHLQQSKWQHRLCSVCHELWPTRVSDKSSVYMCTRCKRDKGEPKIYSEDNDMNPGNIPDCLVGLTQVEEMLIARACPIMCVYRKHGGQRGYKGHVVNLPQDIKGFLKDLPCSIHDLPVLVIRRCGAEDTHADFRVRRERILVALEWLKANNPCYKDITINHSTLQLLPTNGIPQLLTVDELDEELPEENADSSNEEQSSHSSSSFMPLPTRQPSEEEAIRTTLNSHLEWPTIANQPINEFHTPYLATLSFPTLFPYGTGDPTFPGRSRPVTLTDGFKHLIKYGEITADNVKSWRFANHPRFPYWALNMKQRHQLLSQAKIYLQHNPADANLSIEELRTMIGSMSADLLMKRIQRYAAKVQGSNQYWFQRYQELQALLEQKGAPTFFGLLVLLTITGLTYTGYYPTRLTILLIQIVLTL